MDLWIFVALVSTFALPQLLGVLLYFRLVRISKWLAFVLGVFAPPVVFYFVGPAFFFAGLRDIPPGQVACGTPFVVAAMMVDLGTIAELIVAAFVQLFLLIKRS